MHRQICLLAEDGMSPALTKKRILCDDRKKKKRYLKTRVSHKRHEDAKVGVNSIIV